MNLWHSTCWTLLCGMTLAITSCSSGSGGGTPAGAVQSSVQDLTLDPDGTTTVVTFSRMPASVDTSYFSADGGQTATAVVMTGSEVTVTWDARVSPNHTISVAGMPGIWDGTTSPSTTDSSAPTFTITDTAMNPGLGGDTIEVTFAGPRVDEADAEDISSWSLVVNSTPLDLTGSSFVLDVATQVMDITLGPGANLHSNFTLASTSLVSVADTSLSTTPIAGTAAGDAVAPTLTSVTQNLTADEYGRVIDFTFSEAMDPAFSQVISNFTATGNTPTTVSQPTTGVLQVTFNGPVIPGLHTVTASNMMDAHGNSVALGVQAVTQPSPVVNAYTSNEAVTVANVGGDYIEAVFGQAFVKTSAETNSNWTLVVDGNPVVMASQVLSYDFLAKTLHIDLNFDMVNGTAFTLTGAGVQEVDGQVFNLANAGTVGGDVVLPTIVGALQNRIQDPTGYTLDVSFSEDLSSTVVGTLTNYTVGALTIANAVLLGTPNIVRVTLTGGAAVPGLHTVDAINLTDLAGNAMAPVVGVAITSTDSISPAITSTSGMANEGADNDTISVWFDDYMVKSQVEDPTNWTVESPVGNALDTTGATVLYNEATRSAKLTFDAGNDMFFQLGNGYRVSMTGMTDVSANVVTATELDGNVSFERGLPYADSAWRDGTLSTRVEVRFSEHMNYLDDLFHASTNVAGVRYVIRDNGGALRGSPTSATPLEGGLGASLDFGFVINAGDTLDVIGATDLVGNYMYPTLAMPLPIEDATEPDWGVQANPLNAVSGELNDIITLKFDRNLSPWGAEDYRNFTINDGTDDLDLSAAEFEFDGDDTVVITLNGTGTGSLQAADTYSFTAENLQTEQGVSMSAASVLPGNTVVGDTVNPPVIGATSVRIDRSFPNAILIFSDEALDETTAEDTGRWLYNGGVVPTGANLVDATTVRLSFAAPPVAGNNLAYNLVDLAGNATGAASRVVQASESGAPVLVSVSGTSVAGEGGDYISVIFNEPVEASSGLLSTNYSVTNGGSPVTLSSSGAWYDSTAGSVNFLLAAGSEFDSSLPINVNVASVSDHSGNVMPASVGLGGTISGDTVTPPGVVGAFTNFRENSFGLFVDVLFDEAPEESFITNPFNWNVTGGGLQVVLGVIRLSENEYRVSLSGALGAGVELEIGAGLPDLAGNVTGGPLAVIVAE